MKSCPFCAAQLPDVAATACPTCGRDLRASAPAPRHTRTLGVVGALGVTVAVVFAVLTTLAIVTSLVGAYENWSSTRGRSPAGAWNACKEFVAERLPEPATASFASFAESRVLGDEDGPYEVHSYVDAKGDAGAMQRHDFVCNVSHMGYDRYWVADYTLKAK